MTGEVKRLDINEDSESTENLSVLVDENFSYPMTASAQSSPREANKKPATSTTYRSIPDVKYFPNHLSG